MQSIHYLYLYIAVVVGYAIGFLHHAFLENRAKDKAEFIRQAGPLAADIEHKRSLMRGWKGCPDCFGSGGKRRNPCRTCEGSGRLDVDTGKPYKPTNGS